MTLRGLQPEEVTKRPKLFVYGPAGSWKTTVAISFPRPYLIDTERGAENKEYVQRLTDGGGAYYFTASFEDTLAEVKALLAEKHEYRTLVIDPFTIIYNDQIDTAADMHGTEFGRHRAFADRKIRQLLNLVLRLDMNVVITAHHKPQWERVSVNGKTEVREVGKTFDCYPKIDYLFDLVLEIQRRGKECVAIVAKSRIAAFPLAETFAFCYDAIAERYGREILAREAVPTVLAPPSLVSRIMYLVQTLNVPEEIVAKWLSKADADTIADLPLASAEKVLAWLMAKVDPDTKQEV